MTHVGERMKPLHCVTQDMEALAKILASTPRAVSKYRANVPGQGGSDKIVRLRNTSTPIIAFLTFQSRLHMLADCAPRPNVHTLSYGRALYCIRSPGMTRTYVAKEPYGGLGLII